MSMNEKAILQVRDLDISFRTNAGTIHAIRGVNLELLRGETVAIVGESGSGKSVTAYSIMRILVEPGRITGGEILFKGEDIVKYTKKQMRPLLDAITPIVAGLEQEYAKREAACAEIDEKIRAVVLRR